MSRPGTKTLAYAPDVRAYIATDSGVLDVSADISSGTILRTVNAVSNFSLVLNNKGFKYTGKIGRMDRVVIYLKRITWMQAFSGYTSSVPAVDLYEGTCTITGLCTLKRLLNTWWNPELPDSAQLLWQNALDIQKLTSPDAGLGQMVVNLMTQVGGWKKTSVHIQAIPQSYLNFAKHVVLQDNAANLVAFEKSMGLYGFINGDYNGTSTGDTSSPGGSTSGSAIATDAEKYIGHVYIYGGPSNVNGGWDCSSFTSWVLGHDLGLQIPGGSWASVTGNGTNHGPVASDWKTWTGATNVSVADAKPGDLCCWDTHVGFVASDGTSLMSAYDTAAGTIKSPNFNQAGPGGEVLQVRRVKASVKTTTGQKGEPVASGGVYTPAQIGDVARTAGFTGQSLTIAIAVAMAESGGQVNVVNSIGCVGLWQINPASWGSLATKDPLGNAQAAYQISNNGTNWNPWQAYTNGSYQQYMAQAQQAANSPATAPTTSTPSSTNPAASTTKTTTTKVPAYGRNPTATTLNKIYGTIGSSVKSNLVNVNFQGFTIQCNKLVADMLKTIDKQISDAKITTVHGGSYKITEVGCYNAAYGAGANLNSSQGTYPSLYQYGVAIDINPTTNPWDPHPNPVAFDMPFSIIQIFNANGWKWGGDDTDVHNYMQFRYEGGSTVKVTTTTAAPASTPTTTTSTNNGTQALSMALFNILYLSPQWSQEAFRFTDDRKFMDEEQLFTTVATITSAGLRSFQSAPNGDFIAFYPDYFGVAGTAPKLMLQDIEMIDLHIQANDDAMATHVYTIGDTLREGVVNILDWIATSGVVTIDQSWIFDQLVNIPQEEKQYYTANYIYQKYGPRPYSAQFPSIKNPIFEFFMALQVFQQKWSQQYSTEVYLTFMPELYPGMRIELAEHQIQVYVEQVQHTFGRDTGFFTSPIISSPSTASGGITGLPIGRL